MSLIEKGEIAAFLPQGPPFVMVDTLLEQNESESSSGFTPGDENLFVENNKFQVAGMLENIAQTAALRSGYSFSELLKQGSEDKTSGTSPVGYIGSVKKLQLNFLPQANKTIRTQIVVMHRIGQINVIEGRIFQSGTECLKCEMNIFLQDQMEEEQ
ncbi:MAG: hypothetical protein WD048_00670 [Chitinophagales bacterium]